ncbi:APLNR [Mytilus edulis]|uniref:APLNR n=1 Tax=Mytilus edulis TaxID=6550 RepID=A0A8S3UIA7_MYTED|nr:APLNR [Mytilus edulis]
MEHNDTNKMLMQWHSEFARNIIGNITALSVYMICGLIGNTIVIVVYKYQLKDVSDEYFIPVLAVADLIACIVCPILDIIFLAMHLNYKNSLGCKIALFFITTTAFTSVFVLMCIAVQRYLKICKNITISLYFRRAMVALSFLLAVSMAVPLAMTYDHIDFASEGIIVGKRCGKMEYDSDIDGAAYGIVYLSVNFLILVSFIFLYGRIGCTIYGHFKRNNRVKNKFTLMFMIITLVFAVSVIPVGIILTLEGIMHDFWDNLSRNRLIVVLWLYHTYLINNFINPFIYAFLDPEFWKATKTLFKCVFKVNRTQEP